MQKQLKNIFKGIINDGLDFTEKLSALQDALGFMVEEDENPLEDSVTNLLLEIVDFQDVGSSASVLSQYLTEYARNLRDTELESHNINLGISEAAKKFKFIQEQVKLFSWGDYEVGLELENSAYEIKGTLGGALFTFKDNSYIELSKDLKTNEIFVCWGTPKGQVSCMELPQG